ncbi:hypothetical protein V8C40DRAFT_254071 [Trichoderma camerunense]
MASISRWTSNMASAFALSCCMLLVHSFVSTPYGARKNRSATLISKTMTSRLFRTTRQRAVTWLYMRARSQSQLAGLYGGKAGGLLN